MNAATAAKAGHDVAGAPTAEDDERLRSLIRTELDRQHARPVARRTLELLAESAAEPTDDELGYRIVDRNGAMRFQRDLDPDEDRGDVTAPMTLRDLVAELRERYPDLFVAPPEPGPEPLPPPPSEPEHDTLAEVRAAGARFVETRSALAKSVATSVAATSTERGRALASAASEQFEGLRERLGARLKARTAPAPAAVEQPDLSSLTPAAPPSGRAEGQAGSRVAPREEEQAGAGTVGQGTAGWATGRMGGVSLAAFRRAGRTSGSRAVALARRGREALSRFDPDAVDLTWLRRATFIGLGAACLIAIAAAVIVLSRNQDGAIPVGAEAARTDGGDTRGASRGDLKSDPKGVSKSDTKSDTKSNSQPTATAPEEAKPGTAAGATEGAPEDAEARPAEDVQPPPDPNTIAGVPQVIDTATLRIAGKVLHLFGVEWIRGGQAEELTKYLRGRTVACRPAPGSSAYLCRVEGRDLSEVVLFNGGGRASAEASPDLVAAEDHARSERLGVWKR